MSFVEETGDTLKIASFCCIVLQKMAREDGQVAPEFADAGEGDIRFCAIKPPFF